MKYKALILDLDGTTVGSSGDSLPSQRVKEAVKKAKKNLIVTVATGRPLYFCKNVLDSLSIDAPCVVNGGAEIIDMETGQFLFKKYISVVKQKAAYKLLKALNVEVYSSKDQYRVAIENENQITEDVPKLFIGAVAETKSIELLQAMEAIDGIAAHLTTSWSKGKVVDIHITDANATKKHGIEQLLRILKVAKEEVIGIGDYHNDLPLLESVGLKLVMDNAPDELKAIADHVVPDLAHDGVAVAIEEFILNKQP